MQIFYALHILHFFYIELTNIVRHKLPLNALYSVIIDRS